MSNTESIIDEKYVSEIGASIGEIVRYSMDEDFREKCFEIFHVESTKDLELKIKEKLRRTNGPDNQSEICEDEKKTTNNKGVLLKIQTPCKESMAFPIGNSSATFQKENPLRKRKLDVDNDDTSQSPFKLKDMPNTMLTWKNTAFQRNQSTITTPIKIAFRKQEVTPNYSNSSTFKSVLTPFSQRSRFLPVPLSSSTPTMSTNTSLNSLSFKNSQGSSPSPFHPVPDKTRRILFTDNDSVVESHFSFD